MAKDIFGQALWGHFKTTKPAKLFINNKYGPKEEMPLDVYFRGEEDMPDLELLALSKCRGRVLDIGAGAGSHALVLQHRGVDVTAMDISGRAVDIMLERGVKQAFEQDIYAYGGEKYDTLLLLMNGIGLTGNIQQLRVFLQHTKKLLKPGGQLLFDSSDIAYLYEGDLPAGNYYGELWYQYAYKGQKTDWFQWLYIDADTLIQVAAEENWAIDILDEDDMDGYLARLMVIE
ncbi:class I SAM-dependent methyltransferase [Mucilaginibacter sp. ZT4R22]|uniref:Class I SAM-dependent methyltransferase n=1 Tax=Mucilaginibacter pankratovii TaxID=2772110 RepID=A0ABR7WUP9_9SPHI|nr:class I SAM-dependent methyltransferase [Mucilaginibacter pankratovii]MBD1366023.1 class I SAM-dependent methyltransferase [Mucilaginibacter pankratovii]